MEPKQTPLYALGVETSIHRDLQTDRHTDTQTYRTRQGDRTIHRDRLTEGAIYIDSEKGKHR